MRYFTKRDLIAIVLAVVLVIGMIGVTAWRGVERRNGLLKVCGQVELVKKQITVTLNRSKDSLPTIKYYEDHPDELKKALENTNKALSEFKPVDCKELF